MDSLCDSYASFMQQSSGTLNDVCIVLVQIGLKIDQTFTKTLQVDVSSSADCDTTLTGDCDTTINIKRHKTKKLQRKTTITQDTKKNYKKITFISQIMPIVCV